MHSESVTLWRDARRRSAVDALQVRFSPGRPLKLLAVQRKRACPPSAQGTDGTGLPLDARPGMGSTKAGTAFPGAELRGDRTPEARGVAAHKKRCNAGAISSLQTNRASC
jgi:hypothetical protein